MAATDRSETADSAVRWAASFAAGLQAELLLLQVLVPEAMEGAADGLDVTRIKAGEALSAFAQELAGPEE